ncbi:acyl-CoA carboxylase subunit epsilon [Nocardia brasiliensis]|uniref:acyl-CoA carboxylase subunit epsilon n=1 Tax=Nocardia brasiliensis TaxID=37326 RepID=UPI001895034E|nr:acyl-CoA carboxylase subunit epsilon [Nocardia brasiliensis]MBF6125415.1 acyl-CoA carboxylase subunit epsilon [Nocardia brasiliensis]MBF6544912.1 acyl-CoA carboxylase subunit epsilon [Nocardia brasiliensis]
MTTVAEEDVLTAAELDLSVGALPDQAESAEGTAAAADTAATGEPFFRVLKGNPSDEEIAALVCVLSAAAEDAAAVGSSGPTDMWGRPTFMHRGTSPFSPYAFPQLSHLRG